ncbi:unnamed protein product [Amoebophrya sp. A120]|nr:unnamed protein product [Amoebophrya sp. A120]|eukprot:GSA120T00006649001.1
MFSFVSFLVVLVHLENTACLKIRTPLQEPAAKRRRVAEHNNTTTSSASRGRAASCPPGLTASSAINIPMASSQAGPVPNPDGKRNLELSGAHECAAQRVVEEKNEVCLVLKGFGSRMTAPLSGDELFHLAKKIVVPGKKIGKVMWDGDPLKGSSFTAGFPKFFELLVSSSGKNDLPDHDPDTGAAAGSRAATSSSDETTSSRFVQARHLKFRAKKARTSREADAHEDDFTATAAEKFAEIFFPHVATTRDKIATGGALNKLDTNEDPARERSHCCVADFDVTGIDLTSAGLGGEGSASPLSYLDKYSALGVTSLREEFSNGYELVVLCQGGGSVVAEEFQACKKLGIPSTWFVVDLSRPGRDDPETVERCSLLHRRAEETEAASSIALRAGTLEVRKLHTLLQQE